MPCSLYNRSRLIAYLYHQAVQLLGSTAGIPAPLSRGKSPLGGHYVLTYGKAFGMPDCDINGLKRPNANRAR